MAVARLVVVVEGEGDAVAAGEERPRLELGAWHQLEKLLEDAACRPDVHRCAVRLLEDDLGRAVP